MRKHIPASLRIKHLANGEDDEPEDTLPQLSEKEIERKFAEAWRTVAGKAEISLVRSFFALFFPSPFPSVLFLFLFLFSFSSCAFLLWCFVSINPLLPPPRFIPTVYPPHHHYTTTTTTNHHQPPRLHSPRHASTLRWPRNGGCTEQWCGEERW